MEELVYLGVRVTRGHMALLQRVSKAQGDSGVSAAVRRIFDDWERGQVVRALVDTPARYEATPQGDECDTLAKKASGVPSAVGRMMDGWLAQEAESAVRSDGETQTAGDECDSVIEQAQG